MGYCFALTFQAIAMPAIQLVMIEPDIPQNCGGMMRLGACFGAPLHLVEPFGFVWDEAKIRRVAMDYADLSLVTRHRSFAAFQEVQKDARRILLTTKGADAYDQIEYQPGDMLLLGRESAGAPEAVHQAASLRVFVPLQKAARSLNVVTAAAIVLAHAVSELKRKG